MVLPRPREHRPVTHAVSTFECELCGVWKRNAARFLRGVYWWRARHSILLVPTRVRVSRNREFRAQFARTPRTSVPLGR